MVPANPDSTLIRRQVLQRLGVLGVSATAAPLFSAPPAIGGEHQPRRGGTLAIATDAFPVDLIPASSTATATISLISHMYEGLVAADPTTGVGARPSLAESWEISPDGRMYTFKLRRVVRFRDGTPFTAEAIVLNFERLRDPRSRYYYKVGHPVSNPAFANAERVEAVDDYTARYYLKQREGDFIYLLKHPYALLLSPAVIKQFPSEEVAKHPVGTGPFRLVKREEGSRVVFERFDGYWGGASYLDRLIYLPYGDPGAREAALVSGGADLMTLGQIDSVERFLGRFEPFKRKIGPTVSSHVAKSNG